jgi:hypothetical protein
MNHRDNRMTKTSVATRNLLAAGPEMRGIPRRATKKTHPAKTTALKRTTAKISSVDVPPPSGGSNKPNTCKSSQEKNKTRLQRPQNPPVAKSNSTKIENSPLENIVLTILTCLSVKISYWSCSAVGTLKPQCCADSCP